MKIGFIGLGNLGLAIAENLLSTQKLHVYNRTKLKAEPLVNKGAILCNSIKEVAEQCDILFSIVSDDAAVKAITSGNEGIITHLKKGGIHVSLSTILPETSIELAELHQQKGSVYLAGPVMGRPDVAKARKINFLVSGDSVSIQKIKPLLHEAGGAGVWEFGDNAGAANIAKLCSNFLIMSAMEAMAEGINLANKSGIDARQWMHMLTQTLFNSPAYINYSRIILDEAFSPVMFSTKLGLKDMNLVLHQAEKNNVQMPTGKQVQALLKKTVDNGMGEDDVTSVAKIVREL